LRIPQVTRLYYIVELLVPSGYCVTENGRAGLICMTSVVVSALCSLNKRYLMMECAAASAGQYSSRALLEQGIEVVGQIPFDTVVTEAMVRGLPITDFSDGAVSQELRRVWTRIKERLSQ